MTPLFFCFEFDRLLLGCKSMLMPVRSENGLEPLLLSLHLRLRLPLWMQTHDVRVMHRQQTFRPNV
jgi:hypothetical protein